VNINDEIIEMWEPTGVHNLINARKSAIVKSKGLLKPMEEVIPNELTRLKIFGASLKGLLERNYGAGNCHLFAYALMLKLKDAELTRGNLTNIGKMFNTASPAAGYHSWNLKSGYVYDPVGFGLVWDRDYFNENFNPHIDEVLKNEDIKHNAGAFQDNDSECMLDTDKKSETLAKVERFLGHVSGNYYWDNLYGRLENSVDSFIQKQTVYCRS
jgi:hypothetical protein